MITMYFMSVSSLDRPGRAGHLMIGEGVRCSTSWSHISSCRKLFSPDLHLYHIVPGLPRPEPLRNARDQRVTCGTLASSPVRKHFIYARVLNEIGRRDNLLPSLKPTAPN